jgi:hypothetical protein
VSATVLLSGLAGRSLAPPRDGCLTGDRITLMGYLRVRRRMRHLALRNVPRPIAAHLSPEGLLRLPVLATPPVFDSNPRGAVADPPARVTRRARSKTAIGRGLLEAELLPKSQRTGEALVAAWPA